MVYDLDFPGNIDNRLRVHEEKYTNDLSTPLPPQVANVIQDIVDETERDFENSQFMTTETQRKLLYQLVKLFRSSRVLEIGTFTGVSTITMASALPTLSSSIIPNDANGNSSKLISLEIDPKAMNIARKHIQKLKDLDDRVELILGLAMESLKRITKERPGEQYDFIFIDADKGGYISYFDFIMDNNLLSDNGVIIADNVLFYGQVHRQAGYADMKPINFKRDIPGMAKQIHQFNEHVLNDKRVQVVILPLFDGVSIITKNK